MNDKLPELGLVTRILWGTTALANAMQAGIKLAFLIDKGWNRFETFLLILTFVLAFWTLSFVVVPKRRVFEMIACCVLTVSFLFLIIFNR